MELSFGEKIKNLREDSDLTQGQLGKLINMTQRKISYIENNKYEPSIDDIRAFCLFFRISADYLLDLPEKK
ncbi:MAG: helix-turn-helix transcriptional regulator [Clostridia bacterium]|nr:helix-turn-helix transcriptional regulator [Clostridia bacterium]